jgi:hypothetical protein
MHVTISSQVVARIETAFTPRHCDRLVAALLAAYTTARDNWKPDEGSISQTFGYDAWAFGNFRLRELADDATLGFVPEIHEGRFTLRKEGLFLSSYKAGSSRDADIWRSFPKNQHAAPQLARNNSQLDIFLDGDPSPDAPVDLVPYTCVYLPRWRTSGSASGGLHNGCGAVGTRVSRNDRRVLSHHPNRRCRSMSPLSGCASIVRRPRNDSRGRGIRSACRCAGRTGISAGAARHRA